MIYTVKLEGDNDIHTIDEVGKRSKSEYIFIYSIEEVEGGKVDVRSISIDEVGAKVVKLNIQNY